MALGGSRIHHDKYAFIVEIKGVAFAGFNKCSGLKWTVDPIEYREGGGLFPSVTPGQGNFEPVTLERGAALDVDMMLWAESVANSLTGQGLPSPSYERDVDIVQLNRAGQERERFRLFGAFPISWTPGDWEKVSEKRIEALEFRFQEMLYLPQASAVS